MAEQWILDLTEELQRPHDPLDQDLYAKSIYRVPKILTDVNSQAYEPKLASFGPYHHDCLHLRPMEQHKHRALIQFLRRIAKSSKTPEDVLVAMRNVEPRLLASYDCLQMEHEEQEGLERSRFRHRDWCKEKDEYLKLMIVDGCFALEVMLAEKRSATAEQSEYDSHDSVFGVERKSYVIPDLKRDMFLLENQIPLLALTTLAAIDGSGVIHEWPGLPHGVKFDPSDQELLQHLMAKVRKDGVDPHPFINGFIPTVEEEDGICYTHPQKLPGVKQDGSVSHFFHRTCKAYNTGTRKRRKISTDDHGDVRWHKTGKAKPVLLDGEHLGCKKIMVLYVSATKGGKAEKTNWVMHQYHLGIGEDEKYGEFVVSKIFYQQQFKPCERSTVDPIIKTADEIAAETEIAACTGSVIHEYNDECQDMIQSSEETSDQIKVDHDPMNDTNNAYTTEEKLDNRFFAKDHETSELGNEGPAQDSQSAEDPKWWEGESQFLLDHSSLLKALPYVMSFCRASHLMLRMKLLNLVNPACQIMLLLVLSILEETCKNVRSSAEKAIVHHIMKSTQLLR